MTWTVAVAGKGGTGKTTVAALLVKELLGRGKKPVLAVDSDPDANLSSGLGLEVHKTVGQVQQEWLSSLDKIPTGMSKQQYLLTTLNAALSEGRDVDLLTMGRPEGPGCYCSANAVLRDFVSKLQPNYPAVVVDNEAGMEHISRRTVENVDMLLMIAEATPTGMRTVSRLIELTRELEVNFPRIGLVINRANGDNLHPKISESIESTGVELLGAVPGDPNVEEFAMEEKSLLELPDDSPAVAAIQKLTDKLFSAY